MFRFRNLRKCRVDAALVDRSVEPRLAQVFVPKLKLDRLFERYGVLEHPVNLVNSVNSAGGLERPPESQTPFII